MGIKNRIYSNISILTVLVCMGLGVFVCSSVSYAQQDTLRLTTGLWVPYTGKKLPDGGIATRLVKEVFTMAGYRPVVSFRPWKRAFEETKMGRAHASFLWRKTPEREKFFYFSEPVLSAHIVLFHLKEFPLKWKTVQDLRGLPLVGVIGLNYSTELEELIRKGEIQMERVATQEQALLAVATGRAMATPAVRESGYATIEKNFDAATSQSFTHHPTPLSIQKLHVVVSRAAPKAQKILADFNEALCGASLDCKETDSNE